MSKTEKFCMAVILIICGSFFLSSCALSPEGIGTINTTLNTNVKEIHDANATAAKNLDAGLTDITVNNLNIIKDILVSSAEVSSAVNSSVHQVNDAAVKAVQKLQNAWVARTIKRINDESDLLVTEINLLGDAAIQPIRDGTGL